MAEDSPFANFVPSTETAPVAGKPAKKERKKRGAKKPAATAPFHEGPPTKPEKPPRKKRAPKADKPPRAIKVDPLAVFGACVGLGMDDVAAVACIMQTLQKMPKKSRGKVINALGKIFA